jgi:superfamily I DNA/RNA helicase
MLLFFIYKLFIVVNFFLERATPQLYISSAVVTSRTEGKSICIFQQMKEIIVLTFYKLRLPAERRDQLNVYINKRKTITVYTFHRLCLPAEWRDRLYACINKRRNYGFSAYHKPCLPAEWRERFSRSLGSTEHKETIVQWRLLVNCFQILLKSNTCNASDIVFKKPQ